MDYSKLTNEELNGAVIARLRIGHPGCKRDFPNNPADWGALLERERIDVRFRYSDDMWAATAGHYGDVDASIAEAPGRAVCIAYLEASS